MIPDRLHPVLAAKRDHVAARKLALPLSEIEAQLVDALPVRGFARALRARVDAGRYALIAEIKQASPSRGLIRADFDPPALARAYKEGGAACLSILTDTPFFQGRDEHLGAARAAVDLPVLRKDFVIDLYQVAESRLLGADCILLIMAAVEDGLALEIHESGRALGMDVLVEVHDAAELERALRLGSSLVGINNRNLKTLEIDLTTSVDLAGRLPRSVLAVGESGLSAPADLARLRQAGISAFLVGESLLKEENVAKAVQSLLVDRL